MLLNQTKDQSRAASCFPAVARQMVLGEKVLYVASIPATSIGTHNNSEYEVYYMAGRAIDRPIHHKFVQFFSKPSKPAFPFLFIVYSLDFEYCALNLCPHNVIENADVSHTFLYDTIFIRLT